MGDGLGGARARHHANSISKQLNTISDLNAIESPRHLDPLGNLQGVDRQDMENQVNIASVPSLHPAIIMINYCSMSAGSKDSLSFQTNLNTITKIFLFLINNETNLIFKNTTN